MKTYSTISFFHSNSLSIRLSLSLSLCAIFFSSLTLTLYRLLLSFSLKTYDKSYTVAGIQFIFNQFKLIRSSHTSQVQSQATSILHLSNCFFKRKTTRRLMMNIRQVIRIIWVELRDAAHVHCKLTLKSFDNHLFDLFSYTHGIDRWMDEWIDWLNVQKHYKYLPASQSVGDSS